MTKKTKTLFAAIGIVAMLTGCGDTKKGYCEGCGQHEVLHKYISAIARSNPSKSGEVYWLCDDCTRWYKIMGY